MTQADSCFYNPEKRDYERGTPSDASAAMLAELQPSLLALSVNDFHAGSAVVIDDQDHAATDMHVALIGRQLQVRTPSGRTLDARIEKLDVIKDLAILKVPGLNESGARPARLDLDVDSREREKAFAIGAPWAAAGRPVCVSEGSIQGVKSSADGMRSQTSPDWPFTLFDFSVDLHFGKDAERFVSQNKQALIGRAREWDSMPRIVSDAVATNGVSGGALATQYGVEGIVQMGSPKAGSRSAPIREFLDLAEKPSRFTFQYDVATRRLQSVLPANPLDSTAAAEARLAEIILSRNQGVIDESASDKGPR
ncbi:MAG: trypsin-like peptidase domain-containing protein [Candidatus Obscuribacterales bacterium]